MDNQFGWYDHLLTRSLESEIYELNQKIPEYSNNYSLVDTDIDLDAYKSYLVRHLEPLIRSAFDGKNVEDLQALIDNILDVLKRSDPDIETGHPLNSVLRALPDPRFVAPGDGRKLFSQAVPKTGFSFSELFTGREKSISLLDELRREIRTASQIELLISFLRFSGVRLVLNDLKEAVERGARIRVLTSVYLGATEAKAVEALKKIGAEVRVSYNLTAGRLHAKCWIFSRPRGLSTAFVGSSNLSKDALTDGLEWNVKATEREVPNLFRRVKDSFEALILDPEFEEYKPENMPDLEFALQNAVYRGDSVRMKELPPDLQAAIRIHLGKTRPTVLSHQAPVVPLPFQQQVLDQIQGEREIHFRFRNLVVLPTGTGKTVIAALDYSRQSVRPRPKLL